jgi:putative aldouronate transport system substrate-binding protein
MRGHSEKNILRRAKMARKLVFSLLLIMITASFSAAKGQQEAAGANQRPVEISALVQVNSVYPYKEDWLLYEELEEKGNAELDLQLVPSSDYDTKLKLIMASGDLPDLVTKVAIHNQSQYPQWATEDFLLPVSDYMDKLPHFSEMIDAYDFQKEINQQTQTDGKNYILPQMYEIPWQKIGFWVREDILEKHNIAMPTTLDEFYTALKAVKQAEPEMIPFANTFQLNNLFNVLGPLFDSQAGWGGGPIRYDEETDSWYADMISENFKEMIAYVAKLYTDGLIYEEQFVADNGQINNLTQTGKVFSTIHWSPSLTKWNAALAKNGLPNAEYVPMLPLAGGPGKAAVTAPPRNVWGTVMPETLADEEKFERVLEFADWSGYSDEGVLINLYGREGTTYKMENGEPVYLDTFKENGIPNLQDMKKEFGLDTNGWNQVYPLDFLTVALNDKTKEYYKQLKANDMYVDPNPTINMSAAQKEDAKLLESPLQDFRNEFMLRVIMGSANLSEDWQDYVAEAKKKGIDELVEIYNTAWKQQ